jgi:hypothetical protein
MSTRSSTFRLGDEIDAAMKKLKERDGMLPSEQARRALVPFLESKGVLKKQKPEPERQRTAVRRRS